MSDPTKKQTTEFLRDLGIEPETASIETLETAGKILQATGKYSRVLEEFCLYLLRMHREAVTKSLDQTERIRHIRLVKAKRMQIFDRIGLALPSVH